MKKKILFNIATLTGGGGAEKILINIVNNLDKEKYDIDIIECIRYKSIKEEFSDNVQILSPFVDRSIKRSGIGKKIYLIYDYLIRFLLKFAPSTLRFLFIKKKYDIEIAFNYLGPSFIVSRNKNGKKICWIHGSIENLKKEKICCNLQKKAFSKLDKIVTISELSEESIRDIYNDDKIIRINNGYDFTEINSKGNEKIELHENGIVFVGRLDANKRVDLLVEACEELRKKTSDFKLYIVGNGMDKRSLEKKVEEKKLNSNIEFIGYTENPYPYIKNAKFICLTSLSEGFPSVLVEAMTLGCPFISTNVGGVKELSNRQQCGLVVKDNVLDISKAMYELLNDNIKRENMSKKCKENVKEYSMENQIKEIEKVFEE